MIVMRVVKLADIFACLLDLSLVEQVSMLKEDKLARLIFSKVKSLVWAQQKLFQSVKYNKQSTMCALFWHKSFNLKTEKVIFYPKFKKCNLLPTDNFKQAGKQKKKVRMLSWNLSKVSLLKQIMLVEN